MSRDADGTLAWGAKCYIDRSLQNVERMTGSLPHKANVPMHPDTHPELDMSEFLDEKGCELVQSLIGMLQWTVTLGRFDIACAVMTLSKHRVFPRQGHLQHILQVFGYLWKYPDGALRFCTGIPDHESSFRVFERESSFRVIERECEKMFCSPIKEEISHNAPDPKELCMRVSA